MPTIGVRELRQQTTKVLRQVREDKAEYLITYQGTPVARLSPVDEEAIEKAVWEAGVQGSQKRWQNYEALATILRRHWPAEQESEALVDEIRS